MNSVNSLDLKCPKEDLSEYPPRDCYVVEDLRDFITVLTTVADALTSENPLWTEMKVLHNIQVKYKRIFRCNKCLIFLQRVGHCLKKMVLLNLSRSYLDLAERFLIGFQDPSITLHLPSRQQVEYILIRTLTASKLVCEAIKYSQESFCYLIQKLNVGHLILDLVMAASVTARLNVLLQATLEQLCSMYKQVLSWRYKIKSGAFQWAEKLDLPQDVGEWLKTFEPSYLKPFPISKDDIDTLSSILNQKNENVESDPESVILINEVVNRECAVTAGVSRIDGIDYGEVIPRKQANKSCCLTDLQISLLQKIFQVQSLKDLENLWHDISNFPRDHFPKALTVGKKQIICKLLAQIKKTVPVKKFNKTFKKKPAFLKTVVSVFCKHLGFSQNQIKMCRKAPDVLGETEDVPRQLKPVKTLKKLRLLYKQLCEILKFTDETEKRRKLRKIFKRRIADIKLLKQNGEKMNARKLIFCTSKEFLTLSVQ